MTRPACSPEASAQHGNMDSSVASIATNKGESTMRKMTFAMIACALTVALGALAPSHATAQNAVLVAPNGDVGIGTSSPIEKLHVLENVDAVTVLRVENPNSGASTAGALVTASDIGGLSVISHSSSRALSRWGHALGGWTELLQWGGSNGLIVGTASSKPLILGTNNTHRVHITGAGSVGVGTSAPASLFHVNGGDIRVSGGSFIDDGTTLNAPDYVFEPEYDLMPLDELQAFIAQEKHLPNVPSAREVKEQGLNLSQFQMRLLEKVEELTLYTLALHKENGDLKARLAVLEETRTPARLPQ